jgi:hypothetical protein
VNEFSDAINQTQQKLDLCPNYKVAVNQCINRLKNYKTYCTIMPQSEFIKEKIAIFKDVLQNNELSFYERHLCLDQLLKTIKLEKNPKLIQNDTFRKFMLDLETILAK